MTPNELKAVWCAIRKENRPIFTKRRKIALGIGFLVVMAFAVLSLLEVHSANGLIATFLLMLIITMAGIPWPGPYCSECFRNKRVSVSTIEKLRPAVSPSTLGMLALLKQRDDEQCLRVSHLYSILDADKRHAEAVLTKQLAEKQRAALEEQ